jgi:hypothetical protein
MTTTVNPTPTLDLADAMRKLHRRLDFDLKTHFIEDAREAATVAKFLAKEVGTVPARALAARGRAVVRYLDLEGRRYG